MKSYFKIQLLALALLSWGSFLNGKIEHINSMDDFKALTSNHKLVFVKIAAEWCGACKLVKEPFIAKVVTGELPRRSKLASRTVMHVTADRRYRA